MDLSLMKLIIVYVLIIVFNKKFRKIVVDAFFLVISPYVFIIVINNVFMTHYGFYRISDDIINMHLIAIVLFYIGSVIGQAYAVHFRILKRKNKSVAEDVSYKKLLLMSVSAILFILLGKLLLIRQNGLMVVLAGGDEYSMQSIFNHVELALYPLTLVLFDFFLEKKKLFALILSAITCLLVFMTFIKYHIISILISVFIYISIKNRKYIFKVGILTLSLIVFAFVANYAVNFFANGVTVRNDFYIKHFWGYLVGGTINISNVSYTFGNSGNWSIVSWLFLMLTSFPSMITNKLFGWKFSNYDFGTVLPNYNIGGSSSNVVSILGSAFIQGRGLSFVVFMLMWGMLLQILFVRIKNRNKASLSITLIGSIFLAYNMLSFFSSFFVLSAPWETMIWAFIISKVISSGEQNKDQIEKNKL